MVLLTKYHLRWKDRNLEWGSLIRSAMLVRNEETNYVAESCWWGTKRRTTWRNHVGEERMWRTTWQNHNPWRHHNPWRKHNTISWRHHNKTWQTITQNMAESCWWRTSWRTNVAKSCWWNLFLEQRQSISFKIHFKLVFKWIVFMMFLLIDDVGFDSFLILKTTRKGSILFCPTIETRHNWIFL